MDKMAALGERTNHLPPSTYHYLRFAESQYRRYIAGKKTAPLKKYFYSLRPALALPWMRTHPEKPVPMSLAALMDGVALPAAVGEFIEDLLQRNAKTKEVGRGPRVAALDTLIEEEIELSRPGSEKIPPVAHDILDAANDLFRELVTSKEKSR